MSFDENHYIEFIPRITHKDIKTIFSMILKHTHHLTINDFYYDISCGSHRFYIFENKKKTYVNQQIQIERELHELYKDGIIRYAGFQ